MRLDAQIQYCADQTLTATGDSANFINHREPELVSLGKQMAVLVVLKADPGASGSNETYSVKVQTDDNSSFSSPTDVTADVSIPRTSKKGDRFIVYIPKNVKMEKYSRLRFTLGGLSPSLTVDAFLTDADSIESWKAYEDRLTF